MNRELEVFCDKWIAILSNPDYRDMDFIENIEFPDECRALGFIMDCGDSFVEKYGKDAFDNPTIFSKNIEMIDNPVVLGSGIFSQWRYYSHWAMAPFKGSDKEEWVLIAFKRLKALSSMD